MKKIALSTFVFMIISSPSWGLDSQQFNEIIDKHSEHGHLPSSEVDNQKFELINNKEFKFKKQARSIASQLGEAAKEYKFKNPPIEINID